MALEDTGGLGIGIALQSAFGSLTFQHPVHRGSTDVNLTFHRLIFPVLLLQPGYRTPMFRVDFRNRERHPFGQLFGEERRQIVSMDIAVYNGTFLSRGVPGVRAASEDTLWFDAAITKARVDTTKTVELEAVSRARVVFWQHRE